MGETPYLRNCAIWAIVVSGHVVLVLLFSNAGTRGERRVREPDVARLLVIELRPLPAAGPTEPEPMRAKAHRRHASPPPATSITVPAETLPSPAIDWYRQLEETARAAVESDVQASARRFAEPASPGRKCRKREARFEWNPEERKVGIAGGLPYIRLGRRCVLGLGFFGCDIGKPPEPNSHLFVGMNDPDREESSVPELPLPGAEDCD